MTICFVRKCPYDCLVVVVFDIATVLRVSRPLLLVTRSLSYKKDLVVSMLSSMGVSFSHLFFI